MTVEYLAPGVYVEEIEGGHREIDGVSTSTAPFVGLYLVERARLPATTPAWTDYNQVDPGITLLQVIAYQAESLLYRAGELPEVARLAAARLAVAALALASGRPHPQSSVLNVVAFVAPETPEPGRLAKALDDLCRVVDAHRRAGYGTVEGLAVSTSSADGPRVDVGAGHAVGPRGGDVGVGDDDPASTRHARVKRRNDD